MSNGGQLEEPVPIVRALFQEEDAGDVGNALPVPGRRKNSPFDFAPVARIEVREAAEFAERQAVALPRLLDEPAEVRHRGKIKPH